MHLIDHVCLIVKDIKKSRTYYEQIFGVAGKEHPGDKKIYMFESPEVHFFLMEADFPREFIEKQHISFRVDDLHAAKMQLEEKGIKDYKMGRFEDFQYVNYDWVEWRDPDGIRLEFVEVIK